MDTNPPHLDDIPFHHISPPYDTPKTPPPYIPNNALNTRTTGDPPNTPYDHHIYLRVLASTSHPQQCTSPTYMTIPPHIPYPHFTSHRLPSLTDIYTNGQTTGRYPPPPLTRFLRYPFTSSPFIFFVIFFNPIHS